MTGTPANQATAIRGSLLARNTLLNLLGQGLPLLVAVATIPYVIGGLGVERFGVLSLAWVVVGYFGVFNLGLERATIKLVAERLGRGEARLEGLVWTSAALHLLLGVVAGAVLAGVTPLLAREVFSLSGTLLEETKTVFYILAVSLPFGFLAQVFRGVLAAFQRFDLVNAVQAPASVLSYLIPAGGVYAGLGLPGIVLLLMVSKLGVTAAYAVCCLALLPELRRWSLERGVAGALLGFGGWITVTRGVGPVLLYLDRFLIGALVSVAAVAYYAAPFQILHRVGMFRGSLGATLFPAFSTLDAGGEAGRVERVAGRSAKYSVLLLAPAILLVMVFAREILLLWLGEEFARESARVAQLLGAGVLLGLTNVIPVTLLQGVGRPDIPAKLNLAQLPFYVLLVWVLIGEFGIAGAAAAWSLRVAAAGVLFWVAARRLGKVSFRVLAEKDLVRTYAAVAGLAAGLALASAANAVAWQAAGAAVVLAGFAGASWRYALDGAERETLLGGARRTLKSALGLGRVPARPREET